MLETYDWLDNLIKGVVAIIIIFLLIFLKLILNIWINIIADNEYKEDTESVGDESIRKAIRGKE